MLFDVHCHLTFPHFDADREAIVERAAAAGVRMVNSSVGLDEIDDAYTLAEKFDCVYWTLGLSASELDERKVDETIEAIRRHKGDIVGIGEVGLDHHWVKDEVGRRKEKTNFARLIELSVGLSLPLVVHSRDAEDDTLALLAEYDKTALLHCFSGSTKLALAAVERGHLISIPTNLVYAKSRQKLAKELPLESMVLETDSPYLAPTPKSRNEPANVVSAAEKMVELKGVDFTEVAETTTRNAQRFYGINK